MLWSALILFFFLLFILEQAENGFMSHCILHFAVYYAQLCFMKFLKLVIGSQILQCVVALSATFSKARFTLMVGGAIKTCVFDWPPDHSTLSSFACQKLSPHIVQWQLNSIHSPECGHDATACNAQGCGTVVQVSGGKTGDKEAT